MRKLNRAAASRVRPAKRPALMLIPERLIPGTRATAWAQPIPKAAPKPRPSSSFVAPPEPVGRPEDARADHERERHEELLADLLLEEVVERHADAPPPAASSPR